MEWQQWVHGTTARKPATFDTGDEIRVWFRILEQGKERLGQFEGTVIRYRGSGLAKTFTIRRVTHGEGVERVFPLDAKIISKIEVLRHGRVKRSRLYYLRQVIGKARIASVESSVVNARPLGALSVVKISPDVESASKKTDDRAGVPAQRVGEGSVEPRSGSTTVVAAADKPTASGSSAPQP